MNLVAHMDFENRVPGPDEITKCNICFCNKNFIGNLTKHNYREWNLNI
jgi:cAMP-specific phosphodiesterase 4